MRRRYSKPTKSRLIPESNPNKPKKKEIGVFAEAEERGHEQVSFFSFPEIGLKFIVGIHNSVLGPALGGCRMRLYDNESQAIEDVMRLSEGMSYKNSLAGLDLGGGKACLIADPKLEEGRREVFLQIGECLNALGGRYITAEDMGTNVDDIRVVREVSEHTAGNSEEEGGSGDPSPWTAQGVYHAIRAASARVYGSEDLTDKHITIQGVGHVGLYLGELLKKDGARLTVCDPNEETLMLAASKLEADVVEPQKIYDVKCDIYAPCAVGQTVTQYTVPRLRCKIIAGAANNILTGPEVYNRLRDREIIYCPDFAINSGGVISCASEFIKETDKRGWLEKKVKDIYQTCQTILEESEKRDEFPEIVALELAKERIEKAQEAAG